MAAAVSFHPPQFSQATFYEAYREGGRPRRASGLGRRILTLTLGELIFCHLWSWGDAVPGNSVCPVGHVDDPP